MYNYVQLTWALFPPPLTVLRLGIGSPCRIMYSGRRPWSLRAFCYDAVAIAVCRCLCFEPFVWRLFGILILF